jgi:ecdysteroid 25-hydroxylase CYP306A1
MIIPLQWAVHMNERDWDDPETFNPDRFIGEDGYYQASPFFIPFQTGKRVCLGEELARMMLYLHMANIILNFKIELVGADDFDLTGDCGITLSPKEHKLTFQKRP